MISTRRKFLATMVTGSVATVLAKKNKIARDTVTCVRLNRSYQNAQGYTFRAGTILEQERTGQWALPGSLIGDDCVGAFRDIAGICDPIRILPFSS